MYTVHSQGSETQAAMAKIDLRCNDIRVEKIASNGKLERAHRHTDWKGYGASLAVRLQESCICGTVWVTQHIDDIFACHDDLHQLFRKAAILLNLLTGLAHPDYCPLTTSSVCITC